MDWKELKNFSAKELRETLSETKDELRNLRFDTRALKQVHKIEKARKTVARILTLLKERESAPKVQSAK